MKILLYVLASLCLVSCSSNKEEKNTPVGKADTMNQAKYDIRLVQAPLPFAGLWVNEKYVINIKQKKSPRSFQGIAESITIPDSTLQDINRISGFHEGSGGGVVVVKDGEYYELYDMNLKSRAGTIEIISPEKIKIGDQAFIRLKHPDEKRYDKNILEELLFSGHYQLDNGKEVEFNLDGRVSGLDSFGYYVPTIDYIGPGMDVDQVDLGVKDNRMESFGFKFKSDSLFIYKLHCVEGYDSVSKECGVVEFGDLRYRLLRKG